MKTTTRQQAIANGDSTYYTGQPCKHGHLSPRSVRNKACLECGKINSAAQADRERGWKEGRRFNPRQNQDMRDNDGAMNVFLYGV